MTHPNANDENDACLILSLEADLAGKRLETGRDALATHKGRPVELVAAVGTSRDEMLVSL